MGNAVGTTACVHAIFGVFLMPLAASFGWPRASISAALGIVALAGAIIYPLAGRFADRHGARRMVIVSNILFAFSIAALAFSNGSLPRFYLTFAAIGIFGAAAGTPIFSKVVADWFGEQRGTAMGISAGVGTALGSIIMPVLAAWLVSTQGWRTGYIGIAAATLAIGFPALFLLVRDAPRYAAAATADDGEDEGSMTLRQATGTLPFWLTIIALASGAGCTTALFSHVVPILAERGIGIATGTAVVGIFALVGSLWQIATGRLLDMIDRPSIVIPMYLTAVAGLALLATGETTVTLALAGMLLGIGLGSQYGALPYFIARYFGLRTFGAIIGVMYSAIIAAQGITPILLDASFDARGNYAVALFTTGVCLIAGAALMLVLPRFPAAREKSGAILAVSAH